MVGQAPLSRTCSFTRQGPEAPETVKVLSPVYYRVHNSGQGYLVEIWGARPSQLTGEGDSEKAATELPVQARPGLY